MYFIYYEWKDFYLNIVFNICLSLFQFYFLVVVYFNRILILLKMKMIYNVIKIYIILQLYVFYFKIKIEMRVIIKLQRLFFFLMGLSIYDVLRSLINVEIK